MNTFPKVSLGHHTRRSSDYFDDFGKCDTGRWLAVQKLNGESTITNFEVLEVQNKWYAVPERSKASPWTYFCAQNACGLPTVGSRTRKCILVISRNALSRRIVVWLISPSLRHKTNGTWCQRGPHDHPGPISALKTLADYLPRLDLVEPENTYW